MKIIAIDIGGTEIKGALMTPKVIKEHRVKTDTSNGRSSVVTSLYTVIDALLETDVNAISIVTTGTVDVLTSIITYHSGTIPGWSGINLEDVIKARYNIPLYVENDANGAMIYEMQPYLDLGIKDASMITLGTGVGTGLYINGKIHHGVDYKVEYGHMILHPNGRKCTCGHQGCVEQYISGSALTKEARSVLGDEIDHGSKLFDYIDNKHSKAIELFDNYVKDLALFIHNINRMVDPEIFIIGGGVVHAQAYLLPRLKKALTYYDINKPVYSAKDGNDAGIKGAYYHAYEQLTQN